MRCHAGQHAGVGMGAQDLLPWQLGFSRGRLLVADASVGTTAAPGGLLIRVEPAGHTDVPAPLAMAGTQRSGQKGMTW